MIITVNTLSSQILNLDFEFDEVYKWYVINSREYYIAIDSIECVSGNQGITIKNKINRLTDNAFGGVSQQILAHEYRGKQFEISGFIKTKKVKKHAGIWMRVNDSLNNVVFFDNLIKTQINGTKDWERYQIETAIPKSAYSISFGSLLIGEGEAWFDNLKIKIDDKPILDLNINDVKPSVDQLKWLKSHIIPLSSFNPDSEKIDLKPLKKIIGDAKIIALGEVTHGSSPIFKMKHRLIKYFKECCNYNVFSMEASMPEAYGVGDFVFSGKGNAKRKVSEMGFWTWRTNEVLDLVNWMKNYNELNKRKIKFTGFDMQSFEGQIKILADFSEDVHDNELKKESKELFYLLKELSFKKQQRKPFEDLNLFSFKKINLIKSLMNKYSKNENYSWTNHNVELIVQYLKNVPPFSRDKFMSDNINWIVENDSSESKFVLWAHNGHIRERKNFMGDYLNNKYGDDNYLSIGFCFYNGTYTAFDPTAKKISVFNAKKAFIGTYEYYFNSINEPIFALDLRKIKKNDIGAKLILKKLGFRNIGSTKIPQEFSETSLIEDYDIIIFINNSFPTEIFN